MDGQVCNLDGYYITNSYILSNLLMLLIYYMCNLDGHIMIKVVTILINNIYKSLL